MSKIYIVLERLFYAMENKRSNIELHVHPFLDNYDMVDITRAMGMTNINILALLALNDSIYPKVADEVRKHYPSARKNGCGIKLPTGKCILNAREYSTRENFHILTIGYSFDSANHKTEIRKIIDNGLENKALVILDHPLVDNGETRTAGHISEEMTYDLERLCKEYSGQIALEWNAYCKPWIRKGLQIGMNLTGHNVNYHDVNKEMEELHEKLKKEDYNLPIIADTDVHARDTKHLLAMGTSRIIMPVEGESAEEIVASMKKNIFNGNYENVKEYVDSLHILGAFCFPILFPNHFEKPRG